MHDENYYKAGGIETIDVIEAYGLGFNLGNVVKYVLRADRKGEPIKDLRKAVDYLNREIENRVNIARPKSGLEGLAQKIENNY